MFPETRATPVKKSSLGLPIGSKVSDVYYGEGTVRAVFAVSAGPQYRVEWDNGQVSESMHQSNVKWVADAPKATAVKAVWFRKDDRVKFRHNGKTGTVLGNQPCGSVTVKYDLSGETYPEDATNLTLLYSPAGALTHLAEVPEHIRGAVNAINEERRIVKLRVAADQIRLKELKKAKELLIRL